MTIISRDDLNVGDIVQVNGYGGFAEVLHIEQDGYTPPPSSAPKYIVTVKWGPYNTRIGSAKRGNGIEVFALGKLTPPGYDAEQTQHERKLDSIEDLDEAALLARLAELKASMSTLTQGATR